MYSRLQAAFPPTFAPTFLAAFREAHRVSTGMSFMFCLCVPHVVCNTQTKPFLIIESFWQRCLHKCLGVGGGPSFSINTCLAMLVALRLRLAISPFLSLAGIHSLYMLLSPPWFSYHILIIPWYLPGLHGGGSRSLVGLTGGVEMVDGGTEMASEAGVAMAR